MGVLSRSSPKFETPELAEIIDFVPNWTEEEEAKAKRKLDFTIMPLLMLGFFCLQLDRGNISNAITDSFVRNKPHDLPPAHCMLKVAAPYVQFKDVGIVQDQFNIGQQLLSLGIVLLEIPSNLILYKIGPGKWLSSQVVAFGLVSTFQAFQKSYGAFLATRLLLGLTESGFIPGGLYTLSTWYTRKETSKRVTIFFFGNLGASALSNILAYGILQMGGVDGRPGWFWLFVIMGLFTIVSGFVLAFFLPDSFQNPRSFLLPKLQIFTDRELHILRYRVWKDDPMKSQKKKHISFTALKSALSYWPLYVHVLITLCNNGPLTALGAYTPTIINSFGYPRLKSNALASVGLFVCLPVAFAFSYTSDRFNLRGLTTIVALSINLLAQGLLRGFTTSNDRELKYGILVFVQIFNFLAHCLNIAWMALNARNSEERAVAMAMIIMAANAAGIYGNQLFRQDDRPRYKRGLMVDTIIIAVALCAAVFQAVYFRYLRKEVAKPEDNSGLVSRAESDIEDKRTPSLSPVLDK